jgi:hypothetical protein
MVAYLTLVMVMLVGVGGVNCEGESCTIHASSRAGMCV